MCVVSVSLIVMILGIIAYSENIKPLGVIENIKKALGEITKSSNINIQNDITIIDATDLKMGKDIEHEHIYKTIYDKTNHWEQCIVCDTKQKITTHSFKRTWNNGVASCQRDMFYIDTCTCGYSEKGYKPCVWDGKSYTKTDMCWHGKACSTGHDPIIIQNSYYLNSYGSGEIKYDVQKEDCYRADGTRITCQNGGICGVCKRNWPKGKHVLTMDTRTDKIYCNLCNGNFGTITHSITRGTTVPATYIVVLNINLTNGASIVNMGSGMRNFQSAFAVNTPKATNRNEAKTQMTLTVTSTFNSNWKIPFETCVTGEAQVNGVSCAIRTQWDGKNAKGFTFYPDSIAPTISSITSDSSSSLTEWSKSKPIIISGTENYCNTVTVEILDENNNIVYSGNGVVTNNKYSISCIPELEAGTNGRTFTAKITDACNNTTSQNFTISRIDGVAPEIKSSNEINNEWTKEKDFTFTSIDEGIGNVQIAFNDINDYKLANKNGMEYSRNYKFIGDVYEPIDTRVFYKDELGNINTQVVTINKLDNTSPNITNVSINNNKLNIISNDIKQGMGEGSGVSKYRFMTSIAKLENPEITVENSTEVLVNENIVIPEIYKVKYVYVVAEDLVGNISKVYEIEVPQLELTSKVNLNGNNGKGVVELDWSSYDISNKYFVIYRKQEGEEEWKTIVSLEEKYNSNKYIDNLGNDKNNPNTPNINIEAREENNNIEITTTSIDTGTKYQYYIESYDSTTSTLLNKSNS